jgi:hypothetical protein
MTEAQIGIGKRVRALLNFADVPRGTEGVIDQDYGTGIMIAWDLPEQPLPQGYREYDGKPVIQTNILRDGFDKKRELRFLEVVDG